MNGEHQDQADEQVFDSLRAAFAPVRLDVPLDAVRTAAGGHQSRPDTETARWAGAPVDGHVGGMRLPRRGFIVVAAAAVASVAVAGGITWSLRRPAAAPGASGVNGRIPTDGRPSNLVLSPDGHLLAFWDGRQLQLWDVSDQAHVVRTAMLPPATVASASFSFDGTTLVLTTMSDTSHGAVQLWHVADPTRPSKLGEVPLTGRIGSVALSADGRLLITSTTVAAGADATSTIQLWDVSNPTGPPAKLGTLPVPARPPQLGSFAVSQDGRTLAIAQGQQADGAVVGFWDISDPTRPRQQRTMTAPVSLSGAVLLDMNPPLAIVTAGHGAELWNLAVPNQATKITTLPAAGETEYLVPVLAAYGTTLAVVRGNAPEGGGLITFDQVVIWNITDPTQPARLGTVPITPPGNGECAVAGRVLAVAASDHIALSSY